MPLPNDAPPPENAPPTVGETMAMAPEWIGTRGEKEPDPCAGMTPADRIAMVWPLTVAAWAFAGKPCDASRLRRNVERFARRGR